MNYITLPIPILYVVAAVVILVKNFHRDGYIDPEQLLEAYPVS